jgi:hypothetical protein
LRRSVCDDHRARGADALANAYPETRVLGFAESIGHPAEGTNANRNADASDRTERDRHAADRTDPDSLAEPW